MSDRATYFYFLPPSNPVNASTERAPNRLATRSALRPVTIEEPARNRRGVRSCRRANSSRPFTGGRAPFLDAVEALKRRAGTEGPSRLSLSPGTS